MDLKLSQAMPLIANLSHPILVKDENLKYLGASNGIARQFGFAVWEDMVGLDVYGLKCPVVECADEIMLQDKMVFAKRQPIQTLDIHQFADGKVKMLQGQRFHMYDDEQNLLLIYEGKFIEHSRLNQIGQQLYSLDKKRFGAGKCHGHYQVGGHGNHPNLNDIEMEILFYLVRGQTAKEIANFVFLSHRTVESYIARLKQKFDVHCKSSLVEKVIVEGLVSVVPRQLAPMRVSLILEEEGGGIY